MSGFVMPKIKLNDGNFIPQLGLGTWLSQPGELGNAVKIAIDCGYRHFDCAFAYGNESEVGSAIQDKIQDGTVKREDLFITSKLWNTFHSKEMVPVGLEHSLKSLKVDYLDLYLIHWPMGYKEKGELFPKDSNGVFISSGVDYLETWSAMEECVSKGLVRSIGLSNFNSKQVERVIKEGKIKPALLQVECHPYLNQKKLLNFCRSEGIALTGFGPLGSPKRAWATQDDPVLVEDKTIKNLAEKYDKTPAQILIRYQVQRGVICIPKSVTKSRIESNIKVFDFELADEDVQRIDDLDCNRRGVHLSWVNYHPYYPFHEEF